MCPFTTGNKKFRKEYVDVILKNIPLVAWILFQTIEILLDTLRNSYLETKTRGNKLNFTFSKDISDTQKLQCNHSRPSNSWVTYQLLKVPEKVGTTSSSHFPIEPLVD